MLVVTWLLVTSAGKGTPAAPKFVGDLIAFILDLVSDFDYPPRLIHSTKYRT